MSICDGAAMNQHVVLLSLYLSTLDQIRCLMHLQIIETTDDGQTADT